MHYLVISSICNSKSLPILFVEALARFKSDGTAVKEFVEFYNIASQYCKTSGRKIRCVCVASGVTKKEGLWTLEQAFVSLQFSGVNVEERWPEHNSCHWLKLTWPCQTAGVVFSVLRTIFLTNDEGRGERETTENPQICPPKQSNKITQNKKAKKPPPIRPYRWAHQFSFCHGWQSVTWGEQEHW